MSLFMSAFGPSAIVEMALTNTAGRTQRAQHAPPGAPAQTPLYVYRDGEDVLGEASITVAPGKKVDHMGIRAELKGVVEVAGERSHREFVSALCDLAVPGQLSGTSKYRLNFPAVGLPFDSYDGINVRCRYFIRLCVTRSTYSSNIVSDLPFLVENSAPLPRPTMVKLEVGIEDCLHIEFEYDRVAFGLTDVVTGNVHFLLVKIKIKQMELALVRREMTGAAGAGGATESDTLTRYELMDGCPVRNEKIPIRMYLGGVPDLIPTQSAVAGGMYSVRYFLNLVLVDEEDRRYFKQQEVTLIRLPPAADAKPAAA